MLLEFVFIRNLLLNKLFHLFSRIVQVQLQLCILFQQFLEFQLELLSDFNLFQQDCAISLAIVEVACQLAQFFLQNQNILQIFLLLGLVVPRNILPIVKLLLQPNNLALVMVICLDALRLKLCYLSFMATLVGFQLASQGRNFCVLFFFFMCEIPLQFSKRHSRFLQIILAFRYFKLKIYNELKQI